MKNFPETPAGLTALLETLAPKAPRFYHGGLFAAQVRAAAASQVFLKTGVPLSGLTEKNQYVVLVNLLYAEAGKEKAGRPALMKAAEALGLSYLYQYSPGDGLTRYVFEEATALGLKDLRRLVGARACQILTETPQTLFQVSELTPGVTDYIQDVKPVFTVKAFTPELAALASVPFETDQGWTIEKVPGGWSGIPAGAFWIKTPDGRPVRLVSPLGPVTDEGPFSL